MAIVLPILMSLIFGGVEFGYYFFVDHVMQTSAREGARTGALPSSTNTAVNTAISNAMSAAGVASNKYTVTTSPVNISTAASGSEVTVTITCTWGVVGNGFRPMSLISTNKTMTVSVVMLKEG